MHEKLKGLDVTTWSYLGLWDLWEDVAQISMKNDHDIATDSKQERSSPSKFVSMKFNATVKFGGTHMLSYTPHTP